MTIVEGHPTMSDNTLSYLTDKGKNGKPTTTLPSSNSYKHAHHRCERGVTFPQIQFNILAIITIL